MQYDILLNVDLYKLHHRHPVLIGIKYVDFINGYTITQVESITFTVLGKPLTKSIEILSHFLLPCSEHLLFSSNFSISSSLLQSPYFTDPFLLLTFFSFTDSTQLVLLIQTISIHLTSFFFNKNK